STFLVEGNDRRGDFRHPHYAITERNAEPQADTRLRRYRVPRMASTARASDRSRATRRILLETVQSSCTRNRVGSNRCRCPCPWPGSGSEDRAVHRHRRCTAWRECPAAAGYTDPVG